MVSMDENAFQFAWFSRTETSDGDVFHPEPLARSAWSEDQMHGVAVSGLLARATERRVAEAGRAELVPARFQLDMFRPARMAATTTRVDVVRDGPRLMLLDAVLEQDGEVVARASTTYLKPTQNPEGDVWAPPAGDRPTPPPADLLPPHGQHHVPFFASAVDWSDDFRAHQNAGRHQTWQTAVPIVVGEDCTPFQAVASVADATSMTTNWGSEGVEYINTDVGLALSRPPVDVLVGLRATDHISHDGVAVGVAEVYDSRGVLGVATITAVANTRRTVDFTSAEFEAPTA